MADEHLISESFDLVFDFDSIERKVGGVDVVQFRFLLLFDLLFQIGHPISWIDDDIEDIGTSSDEAGNLQLAKGGRKR